MRSTLWFLLRRLLEDQGYDLRLDLWESTRSVRILLDSEEASVCKTRAPSADLHHIDTNLLGDLQIVPPLACKKHDTRSFDQSFGCRTALDDPLKLSALRIAEIDNGRNSHTTSINHLPVSCKLFDGVHLGHHARIAATISSGASSQM